MAKKYLVKTKHDVDSSGQAQVQGKRSSSSGSGVTPPSGSSNPAPITSDSSVIEVDDTTSNTPVLTNVFVTIDNPTVNGSQNGNVTESITVCGTIPTISAADSGSNANVSAYSQLRIWARMINHAKVHIA